MFRMVLMAFVGIVHMWNDYYYSIANKLQDKDKDEKNMYLSIMRLFVGYLVVIKRTLKRPFFVA